MARKTDMRRAKLRERLIDVAEARIAANGVVSLRARDIARDAECALGAIYTHFDDLQALIMAVNGRTFATLGRTVGQALAQSPDAPPHDKLITMSHAYLRFAEANTNLWNALFALEMSTDGPVPEWYLQALAELFSLIAGPLAQIYPNKSKDELDLSVRTLFSAVHGIVLLGLERRISAVPMAQLERMISDLLLEIGP